MTVHLSGYPHQGGHEASSDCGRFARLEHRDLLWPSQGATLVGETRAFLLPKLYSRLPSNPRDPSPRPMSQAMHRVPCPRYRFDARTPRLGLIGANLDRQVSSTAARCTAPPAIPTPAHRRCRIRAPSTARRHHGRASATMCAASVPPTRPRQVGGNCCRPRSPQSSARASVAITGPPRLLRRLTDGISAK